MSFVKETDYCAPDNVLDKVTTHPVTTNPQTIEATTVRLVKFPPLVARNLRVVIE